MQEFPILFSVILNMARSDVFCSTARRRSVPGSLVWVPASAGLLLCQHVVTELIKD